MEAALSAATILEQRGYPPLVMSLESIDQLDHVIFVYRGPRGWGSVARSRDPGLHGRKPVFRRPRELALSYVDPYVDFTGGVRGYGVADLRALMGGYDWRLSPKQRVGRRAGAHRPAAPARSRTDAARIDRLRREVSRLPRGARRPQADLLRSHRAGRRSRRRSAADGRNAPSCAAAPSAPPRAACGSGGPGRPA